MSMDPISSVLMQRFLHPSNETTMTKIDASRLVIIDDDRDLIDIIDHKLKSLFIKDYQRFYNAASALDILDGGLYVVVVDHFLGTMNGLEVTTILKQKNKANFVIGFSALEDRKVLINYINSDIDRFVDKKDNDYVSQLVEFILVGLIEIQRTVEFELWLKDKQKRYDQGTS